MHRGTAVAIAGAAGIVVLAIALAWKLLDSGGATRMPEPLVPVVPETGLIADESKRARPEEPLPTVIHPRSAASLAGIEGVIRDDNGNESFQCQQCGHQRAARWLATSDD